MIFTRAFLLCSLANLCQGIAFNLFLHFPGFLKELGAAEVQIGMLFALVAVASISMRPAVGTVMDRRGRYGVIMAGNLIHVLAIACYLTVSEIGPWVYVVRILHGVGEALLFTALFAYAADHLPKERIAEGLGYFGVSGMLPIALGGVLGDWILRAGDYRELFIVALGFAVAGLVLSLPLRDRARKIDERGEGPRGFMAALLQPNLLPIWWMTAGFSLALASAFVFVKTFVMEREVGSVGSFFAAYAVMAIAVRVLAGGLPDRVGLKRVLFPAMLSLAAGFALLAFARSDMWVLAAGALCGAGHGYGFPVLLALTVTRARSVELGSAMAIYTALFDVGVLVGGPVLGGVIEALGYTAMYLMASLILLVVTASFAVWDRRESNSAEEPVG